MMRDVMEETTEGDEEGRKEAGEKGEEREVYIARAGEAGGVHSGRHDPEQSQTGRRWTTALLGFHPSETFVLYGLAMFLRHEEGELCYASMFSSLQTAATMGISSLLIKHISSAQCNDCHPLDCL